MKITIVVLFTMLSAYAYAQSVDAYFESIRGDAAALTAFFSQMPKGGDLHHHLSGSIYAETYLNTIVSKDFYVDTITLEIAEARPAKNGGWMKLSSLKKTRLNDIRQLLLQKWSIIDYDGTHSPARQFFDSFNHFGPASKQSFDAGLIEIKDRAKKEKVMYIETSASNIHCDQAYPEVNVLNNKLGDYQARRDRVRLDRLLDSLYRLIEKRNVPECARAYRDNLHKLHSTLKLDDTTFVLRFQSAVSRLAEPVAFFKNLVVAFMAANESPLVVGVTILAPEHYDVAMRDYWLHMQMFRFCHSKFPDVKYSMHAGELTLGLVKPEELTWHISSAVYDAGANRIGHGIDLPYEQDCYSLLKYLREKNIVVEVNLSSNEFILNVKEDRHPLMLYRNAGVPIVISTDDAGILRTNLTEQFVLLAMRYKQITYPEIKRMIYNSIQHSFIKEANLKRRLTTQLDSQFKVFEKKVLDFNK